MKRFLIALLIFLLIPICAFAQQDEYNELLSSYDLSFFEEQLDDDTYELLKELNLENFDFENIYSISFDSVLNIIKKTAMGKIDAPLKSMLEIISFVLLSALFQSLKTGESDLNSVYSTSSALIISVILVVKISSAITIATLSIKLAGNFIFAFIPVFCAIVAAGGGITTSFSTNSTLLILSQGLSFISSNVFMPIINCFLAIGICSGLRVELNLERLINTLKRGITALISVSCAIFVSILSIKTTVSARADILGIRSLRFVINSVVPVIGGSISEGLLSIQSYSSLIKSSVGIVGIIAVALVFMPSIIEIVLWRIMLSLCLLISDIFGDSSVSLVLKAFKDTALLINVVLILSMVTTIISIGILIAARTA